MKTLQRTSGKLLVIYVEYTSPHRRINQIAFWALLKLITDEFAASIELKKLRDADPRLITDSYVQIGFECLKKGRYLILKKN